jgi:hypothetical protein
VAGGEQDHDLAQVRRMLDLPGGGRSSTPTSAMRADSPRRCGRGCWPPRPGFPASRTRPTAHW